MGQRKQFDFEHLDVFHLSLEVVEAIDVLLEGLPEGRSYIRDQLRRAVNSISLNIAEGAGEFKPAEKARFYRMAKRSCSECAGQLLVCQRLNLAQDATIEHTLRILQRLHSILLSLVRTRGNCADPAAG